MVAMKRKAVAVASRGLAKRGKAEGEHEDVEEQPEPVEASQGEEQEEAADEAPEEVSEEQKLQEFEEAEKARRAKELKALPVGELKEIATSKGLETGNKADMVEVVVTFEAKARADARAHEAKLRAIVVRKKEEFEGLSMSELCKRCGDIGLKRVMSKQDRVEHLLKHWQEADGVDKALAQMAHDERKQALESMQASALQELCTKAGVDPFVAEVMVDRISKQEHEMGRYQRPAPAKSDEAASTAEGKPDMVTALLETEKNRKKEKELANQREEAAASRRKELRAMTVDELKAALSSRGAEPTGKKEEMVEALFATYVQEDAVSARKAELRSLSSQELKDLLTSKGLDTGSKGDMIETMLSHEAKLREELQAWDAKAAEVLGQRKDEFDAKTNNELKEMCVGRGLKLGNAKEERVERLLEDLQKSGEINEAVARAARKTRREALNSLSKEDLVQLCAKLGIDPLVKEVIVERILAHEAECGPLMDETAPAAKKARTSKK